MGEISIFKEKRLIIGMIIVTGVIVTLIYFSARSMSNVETMQRQKEVDRAEITNTKIEEKLSQLGKVAACSYEYQNHKKENDFRKLTGKSLAKTDNPVEIIYSGVIKIGYYISDLQYSIDDSNQQIYITLPRPVILDINLKLDELQCQDENSSWKRISKDQLAVYFENMKEDELIRVEKQGVYGEMQQKVKTMIQTYFTAFCDYKVVFQ